MDGARTLATQDNVEAIRCADLPERSPLVLAAAYHVIGAEVGVGHQGLHKVCVRWRILAREIKAHRRVVPLIGDLADVLIEIDSEPLDPVLNQYDGLSHVLCPHST